MIARISNLKNQTGIAGPHEIAYCPICGNECSANKSDYFMLAEWEILKCTNDHAPKSMILVRKVTSYVA